MIMDHAWHGAMRLYAAPEDEHTKTDRQVVFTPLPPLP